MRKRLPLDADILHIGVKLPLDTLTPLLAARIDHMVQAGALEEARAEFAQCPDDAPGWSGIGCRELLGWLRENIRLPKPGISGSETLGPMPNGN